MNRKALELAISTLILIVIGILVLIGLVYAVTGGFKTLKSSSQPFLDTTQASAIKQACSLACQQQDKITLCCKEYEIDKTKIKCTDSRLEVECSLSCQNYNCNPNQNLQEKCKWKPNPKYSYNNSGLKWGVYFNDEGCVYTYINPSASFTYRLQQQGYKTPFETIEECKLACQSSNYG